MVDRVQAHKWESSDQGGTDDDPLPSEIDPNTDGLDARASFYQNDSSSDSDVFISRDASDNLTFVDKVVGSTKTLTDLLAGGGGVEGHIFEIPNGSTLTINAGRQFDHLGRFGVGGRKVIDGRFVLGIGANNG